MPQNEPTNEELGKWLARLESDSGIELARPFTISMIRALLAVREELAEFHKDIPKIEAAFKTNGALCDALRRENQRHLETIAERDSQIAALRTSLDLNNTERGIERAISLRAEQERDSLRGELEAANKHVEILQQQRDVMRNSKTTQCCDPIIDATLGAIMQERDAACAEAAQLREALIATSWTFREDEQYCWCSERDTEAIAKRGHNSDCVLARATLSASADSAKWLEEREAERGYERGKAEGEIAGLRRAVNKARCFNSADIAANRIAEMAVELERQLAARREKADGERQCEPLRTYDPAESIAQEAAAVKQWAKRDEAKYWATALCGKLPYSP